MVQYVRNQPVQWKTKSSKPPTFELLDVEPDRGHDVGVLVLLRLEVVEDGGLARVVQPHHEDIALLFPNAKDVGQLVKQTHPETSERE